MKDLIEALTILAKYTESDWPTICCHDELRVNVNPESVIPSDVERLQELSFFADADDEQFISFRFGSC